VKQNPSSKVMEEVFAGDFQIMCACIRETQTDSESNTSTLSLAMKVALLASPQNYRSKTSTPSLLHFAHLLNLDA